MLKKLCAVVILASMKKYSAFLLLAFLPINPALGESPPLPCPYQQAEIKIVLDPLQLNHVLTTLKQDESKAKHGKIVFFDTPDFDFLKKGFILRARIDTKINQEWLSPEESKLEATIKKRSPDPFHIFNLQKKDIGKNHSYKCEIDANLKSQTHSFSLNRKRNHAKPFIEISSVFSSIQKEFLIKETQITLTSANPRAIIISKTWPWPKGNGKLELWEKGNEKFLELSVKTLAEEIHINLAKQQIIRFLQQHGISFNWEGKSKTEFALNTILEQ